MHKAKIRARGISVLAGLLLISLTAAGAFAAAQTQADALQHAQVNFDAGYLDEALAECLAEIAQTPSAEGYLLLGDIQTALGAYMQAADAYTNAAERGAEAAYYGRGIVYGHLGEEASALADFARIPPENPLYARTLMQTAQVYERRGAYEQAQDYADRAVQHAPEDALLAYEYGLILAILERTEEAIAAFTAALALDAEYMDAYYERALAYEAAGDTGAAQDDFEAYDRLLLLYGLE